MAIRCALVLGKYPEAKDIYERSQKRFSSSLSLKLLARDVYRFTGLPDQGQAEWAGVFEMVRKASWRYSSAADQVQLGRYLLAEGRDAKQILELFYDAVRKNNPKYPDVYIASAELAISKHDYALAAQMLETAVSLQPSNPDIHFLTALAFAESDSEKATAALQETLKLNPNYVDAYLLQAERAIDREDYDAAEILLHHVLTINRFHPQAWALHAVIAHLQGHYTGETALLDVATQFWQTNDAVFHLVGKKLSQKYRFAEAPTTSDAPYS
ncbi:MAG: tetratricopeptide repeat protein [Pirellulaceae bacterium]